MNRRNLIKSLLGGTIIAGATNVLAGTTSAKPNNFGEWYQQNKNAKILLLEVQKLENKELSSLEKVRIALIDARNASVLSLKDAGKLLALDSNGKLETSTFSNWNIHKTYRLEELDSSEVIELIDCAPPCCTHYRIMKTSEIDYSNVHIDINIGIEVLKFKIL